MNKLHAALHLLTTVFLTSLAITTLPAQAEGLYGLNDDGQLVRIDPATAETTIISAQSIAPDGYLPLQTEAEASNDRFFILAFDENEQTRLRAVDLNTGEIINDVPFGSDDYSRIVYDCAEDVLFGLNETTFFSSVDPATGEVTNISGDLSIIGTTGGTGAIDVDGNRYFTYGTLPDAEPRILIIDTETGEFIATPVIPELPRPHLGQYYCETDRLYALQSDFQRFGYLDLNTGMFNAITPADLGLTGILVGERAFDLSQGHYIFIGFDENDERRLYSIDVYTGEVVYNPLIGEDNEFSQLASASRCRAEAEFTFGSTCDDEAVAFTNNSFGTSYEWDFGDPESGDNNTSSDFEPAHFFSAPGTYTVRLIARYCEDTDTMTQEVTVTPRPEAPFEGQAELCKNDSLSFTNPNPEATLTWPDGTPSDATFWVYEDGVYDYTYEINGCISDFSISVQQVDCPCTLEVPNAFTPNNDSSNDRFNPVSEYCEFVTFQLRVYNRWGKLVFETNDPNEGWDGAIDGEAAPSDVYVYTLEYSFLDEDTLEEINQMHKGDVTLLR